MPSTFEIIILVILLSSLSVLISIFIKIRNNEKDIEPDLFKQVFDQVDDSKKIGKLEEQLSRLKDDASKWISDEQILKQNM